MKNKYLQLPIMYEQADFSGDDRFVKVRIKVMHNGLNLNGSSFSDSAIEKASTSLSNIPLLAFVKKGDGVDDADLAGHEYEFKITEDGIKYNYLGRPIGMIPETNNYSYGEAEDGRKFVTVDGYIWTDYANEALDIVQRDGGKNVSMEIKVQNYSERDSVIDITDYKYTGIAFLGEDVPPAMMGARADLAEFSTNSVSEFVSGFAAELQKALAFSAESVDDAPKEPDVQAKVEDEVKDVSTEDIGTPIDGAEETPVVENEEPVVEDNDPIVEDNDPIVEPVVDPVEGEVDPVLGEPSDPLGPSDDPLGEPAKPFEQEIQEIKAELSSLRNELESVRKERDELMSYKNGIEKAEYSSKLEALLSDFSDLEEEEINEIISKENNLDDIELKLFALRGKKNTKAPAKHVQTYAVWDSLIKTSHEESPSWADLVTKHYPKNNEGGN